MFKDFRFTRKSVITITLVIIAISAIFIGLFSLNENDVSSDISFEFSKNQSSSLVIDFESSISNDESSDYSNVFNEISDSSEIIEPIEPIPHGFIRNKFGITYVYGDSGFEQFSYKMTALDRYANSFNHLINVIPETMRVFNITVPVSSTFAKIPHEIYSADGFYNKSQSTFVSTVESKLNNRIVNIPIVELLQEQYNRGESIFFRTDKNWTSLAAFTAYNEFCNKANLIPYTLEEFQKVNVGKFLGSFYNATSSEEMFENPDDFIAYSMIPDVKASVTIYNSGLVFKDKALCENEVGLDNAYSFYLGMDAGRYEIGTTASGGSLLIIGDSSVYPMLPYLACHYTKIDFINPMLFETSFSEFFKNHSYDDVLTMCYSTNAINGEYIPKLNILSGVDING